MNDFGTAWASFTGADARSAPRELKLLIGEVYEQVCRRPTNHDGLKLALARLLTYLSSPGGRTDSNCRTTDLFFCLQHDYPFRHLPADFQGIMADVGGV